MRVLVIGSGAREHALCLSLRADPDVDAVECAPGNAGIAAVAGCHPVEVSDPAAIAALAGQLTADLVVIGPEVPLVAGAADAVRAAGIVCFGPSAAAARLEGSKSFAKDVMSAAGVPTARSRTVSGVEQTAAALDEFGAPYVVKADGLAAGKGVVVTEDRDRALEHAGKFDSVVIEEFLDGPEVSLFCLTDGHSVIPLIPAQDYKRLEEGNSGPNTGGMGAYAPLPWAPDGLVDEVLTNVVVPTIDEMERLGSPYSGLLYVGLALTGRGPKVVEFNARFGDPETQVVLSLLETPLGGLLHATATGKLDEHPALTWGTGAAVTVVMAAEGYPGTPRTGDVITGADAAAVLHAATERRADGALVTAGGRVLSVTATGPTLDAARTAAYKRVAAISFDGAQFRRDIAAID